MHRHDTWVNPADLKKKKKNEVDYLMTEKHFIQKKNSTIKNIQKCTNAD